MTAPNTSPMALDRRLQRRLPLLVDVALDVLDDHDGVVDDEAGGQREAEQGERVDREAEELDEDEGADQRHRDGHGRDDRERQLCRKRKMTTMTSRIASASVSSTSWIDWRTAAVGVERDPVLEARREAPGQLGDHLASLFVDVEGVGVGQLDDAEADRVVAVEAQHRRVVFAAELGAADVLEQHQRAVGRRLAG